jgi:tripartite-type tricarboxylate transporter receptor subunit TctC
MVHVPYRGAALALTDLIGGQLQVMFDTIPSSVEYIRSGKLRALGVGSSVRSSILPDIPIIESVVPGFGSSAWYGLGAPKKTPVEIIDKLHKEIDAGLTDPKMGGRLVDLGGTSSRVRRPSSDGLLTKRLESGPRWYGLPGSEPTDLRIAFTRWRDL